MLIGDGRFLRQQQTKSSLDLNAVERILVLWCESGWVSRECGFSFWVFILECVDPLALLVDVVSEEHGRGGSL